MEKCRLCGKAGDELALPEGYCLRCETIVFDATADILLESEGIA